ncbi:hypothetical protein NPIL_687571 [Nephila pilipes]|uniref:Uncharacterized protein n=1 Tax=Nephila pilipes TaxID=299642 RepID=A0A8X6QB67_NEPPI|nr:hypothetical protein NPIL_523221 [Nephila pilipes]GFU12197.1 hypothetical protein NPIL_523231 [Nephila pilipes]GFU33302.1 hypothetical protein NPIL_6101 [Nephila pilipes]GFU33304.1 hypothetical protein NPIL_6111 [Nephila pilipes]GFU38367.1 hypothetical protein NPIL_393281 [Nephila pilipes]
MMIQLQPLPVQYLSSRGGLPEDEEGGSLDRWEDSDSCRAVDVKRTLCFYFFTFPIPPFSLRPPPILSTLAFPPVGTIQNRSFFPLPLLVPQCPLAFG